MSCSGRAATEANYADLIGLVNHSKLDRIGVTNCCMAIHTILRLAISN